MNVPICLFILVVSLIKLENAKERDVRPLDRLSEARNAVPALFEEAKTNYLAEIDGTGSFQHPMRLRANTLSQTKKAPRCGAF